MKAKAHQRARSDIAIEEEAEDNPSSRCSTQFKVQNNRVMVCVSLQVIGNVTICIQ